MMQATKRDGRTARKATAAQRKRNADVLETVRWHMEYSGRGYYASGLSMPEHNALDRMLAAGKLALRTISGTVYVVRTDLKLVRRSQRSRAITGRAFKAVAK